MRALGMLRRRASRPRRRGRRPCPCSGQLPFSSLPSSGRQGHCLEPTTSGRRRCGRRDALPKSLCSRRGTNVCDRPGGETNPVPLGRRPNIGPVNARTRSQGLRHGPDWEARARRRKLLVNSGPARISASSQFSTQKLQKELRRCHYFG